MKEQFVTYEIALKLKELGFNEGCFGYYKPMKIWMMEGGGFNGWNWANSDNSMYFLYKANSFGDRTEVIRNSSFTTSIFTTSIHNVAVPLWQQCVAWFRGTHNYHIAVYKLNNKWCGDVYDILRQCYITSNAFNNVLYHTYEEALEQAILKAIELIH